ncbi:Putative helicase (fragment) [Blastococcus saxobsidens DD2]|uniref:Putative helicase n=1 Tax=Blastococcus saxobsidens (strain DD2) TaxID=1146883 RepID=H6RLB6_BLASD
MDRALAREHLTGAFGDVQLSELPTVAELTDLIAELEIELVRGLTETGFRADLSPLRRSAWYLHGIASTAETSRYPAEQRRRAFAVSAHVLDLLLEDPAETGRVRLATAFAAQVGYHRADETPNAGAVHRKLRYVLAEPAEFTESADVALHAGILFLGFEMTALNRHLRTWATTAAALTRGAQLGSLDGTMFGPTQRLLRGIADLVTYLREGSTDALGAARGHLLLVVRAEVGISDLDTRWVAGHLLALANGLSEGSVWAVLPPDVPAAVKQAFTLDRQPVLTLWPPQRSLVAHPTISPLSLATSRLLVSVPTSAGKTLLAQLIICAHMAQDDLDVCYVTPLRSLGREMRQALRSRLRYLDRRLGADLPDGFGTQDLTSGGLQDTDESSSQLPQVEVMTPERLMNALRQSPQEVLSRFSLFIIDEAHLIAQSGGRGLRGCPEFRRTSVAARCASGCDDLLIMHGGCDSSGDLGVERGAQLRQVQVAVDPAELLAGLDHAGGAPAQGHLPVPPALDVAGVITTDGDHRLDRVGRAQRAGQRGRHPQAQHGQRLVQAFAQAGSRARVGLVQLPGQPGQRRLGL